MFSSIIRSSGVTLTSVPLIAEHMLCFLISANLTLITDFTIFAILISPINVYLTDSLNPIDEFKPILKDRKRDKKLEFHSIEKWSDYGEVERFNIPAINDSLIINKKFFKYPEQFSEILKELDKNLSKDIKFDDLMKKIYSNINDIWLEEKCEGNSNKTLKDNFEFISQKFFKSIKEDQNHIWA